MFYPTQRLCALVLLGMCSTLLSLASALAQETIQVNFAPATAPLPAGWHADNGAVYGARSGGLTYGWNGDNGS